MRPLRRDDLKRLFDTTEGKCVSLFMPTVQAGKETRQNPIRFKNLVGKARERLLAAGLKGDQADELLEPARQLIPERPFWQRQSTGLAVFLSPGGMRTMRLPLAFRERAMVGDRFFIEPLVPLLSGDGRFYVLALSQKQVRLFEASRHSMSEMDLSGVPTNLAEALGRDEPERHLQYHTRTPARPGRRQAVFHGQGGGEDEDHKKDLLQFFQLVDKGIQDLLHGEEVPVVLAGVDYTLALYRQASGLRHLVGDGVEGSPEEMDDAELHRQSWAVVEPLFHRAQEKAMARYHELAGTGYTAHGVEDVVPMAEQKRVETLFVAQGARMWGRIDPSGASVEVHTEWAPGDEELLDYATVRTLLSGGTVYAMDEESVPGGPPISAVLRF
ncbi:MAG: hypothetical protein R6U88_04040 [Candidatus Bipolaricaulota bacterium]